MPNLGDLTLKILLEIVTANESAKEFGTSLKQVEDQADQTQLSVKSLGDKVEKTSDSFEKASNNADKLNKETSNADKSTKDLSKNLSNAGTEADEFGSSAALIGTGLAAGITALGLFTVEAIKKGAAFEDLRKSFKGTQEDIDLFRKAVDATVTDGALIALSNHATSLNISLEDQAKFFFLSKKASDEYGGGVEQNFEKILRASDGSDEGLRAIGLSTKQYKDELESLTASTGQHLNALSAEEQQHIRLQAIFNLTGVSLDSINEKTQSGADKITELSHVWENFTTSLGLAIVQSGELGKGMDGVTKSVQDAGTKSGNFISTLISLGGWIQSVTSYIYPWIGAYNALSSATQFAIDKVKELISTQAAQQSKQKFEFQYGSEGDIKLDEFGNPIPPKSPDAERSRYKNSKGTLGYKEEKDTGGGSTAKTKEEKETLDAIEKLQKELLQLESDKVGYIAKYGENSNIVLKTLEKIRKVQEDINRLTSANVIYSTDGVVLPERKIRTFTSEDIKQAEYQAESDAIRNMFEKPKEDSNALVSNFQLLSNLAGLVAGKLEGGGKDLFLYLQQGLQIAMQIAQITNKNGKGGGIEFGDILGLLGSILPIFFLASGGSVPGSGSGDTVHTMLTPGEFVLNKNAASKLGPRVLQWLNGGGNVSAVAPGRFSSVMTSRITEVPYIMNAKLKGSDIDLSFRRFNRIEDSRVG